MDLTPDLLLEAKFAPARRGYDMNEVDDFLERCAEGLDVLLARLRAEFERAEAAESALAELQQGSPPAAPVEAEIAEVPEVAPAPATPVPLAEPDPARLEEPMRILLAAERTAETAIADARAEAEAIRSEAEAVASTSRSEAETLLARAKADAEAEARRAGEDARRSIEAEVLALREDREVLAADVSNLRGWLAAQRERMRTTAAELQRLVDAPDALREEPAPALSPTSDLVEDGDDGGPADASGTEGESAAADVVEAPAATDHGPGAHDVVDARTDDDVRAGFARSVFDDGEPTQAVPRLDASVGGTALFDDERAPTASGGLEQR